METISLIGAGNLATRLGLALTAAGYRIAGVFSRTMGSARTLAAALHCEATDDLSTLPAADVHLFSVTDTALPLLAARWGTMHPGSFCLHTAGSMPMTVFEGHAGRYGVLYPMQTFSKTRDVDFSAIPCFVEGSDAQALREATRLALSVSKRVIPMPGEKRRWLHLAAVFACNFTNHCYDIAGRLLQAHGISEDVLLPLIDETAAKVHDMPPGKAQTGPAVRFDQNVIERHLRMLASCPELQEIYTALSRHIHSYAQKND